MLSDEQTFLLVFLNDFGQKRNFFTVMSWDVRAVLVAVAIYIVEIVTTVHISHSKGLLSPEALIIVL